MVKDEKLTDDQKYNADESARFVKMLSNKSLATDNESSVLGRKLIKQHNLVDKAPRAFEIFKVSIYLIYCNQMSRVLLNTIQFNRI